MTVTYYVNGTDFNTYGVKVSGSRGLIDPLKMKSPDKVTWPDHHGECPDLAAPRYESREISLDCYIKAASSTAFILALQTFSAAWQKAGLQRLMIDVNDGSPTRKPLLYEVYLEAGLQVSKKWKEGKMIGTFTLVLREPEPVKRVYSFVASAGSLMASMTVVSDEPVNIYWGDQSDDLNVDTDSGELIHTYSTAGTYYIIITGVIEDITDVITDATLVWSKL